MYYWLLVKEGSFIFVLLERLQRRVDAVLTNTQHTHRGLQQWKEEGEEREERGEGKEREEERGGGEEEEERKKEGGEGEGGGGREEGERSSGLVPGMF